MRGFSTLESLLAAARGASYPVALHAAAEGHCSTCRFIAGNETELPEVAELALSAAREIGWGGVRIESPARL